MDLDVDMSDLVKRLRMREAAVSAKLKPSKFDVYDISLDKGAADRIEQLERALANTAEAYKLELEWRLKLGRDVQALRAELAAEKALADSFSPYRIGSGPSTDMSMLRDAQSALRKARGL